MTRLEQAVESRLDEIRDLFRSGLGELTGKSRKVGHGATLEYGARFRGVKAAFHELRHFKESPGRIAQAIERGSGNLYKHLYSAVRDEVEPFVKKERKERPSIPPHDALTRKCQKCGVAHGKGAHRFHGRGAWLQTHLFPFKANMKNPGGRGRKFLFHGSYTSLILARRKERSLPGGFILKRDGRYYVMSSYPRKNPVRKSRLTKIYGRVLRIEAQKTGKHQCDAECKRLGHRYYHDFKVGPVMYGLPDGSLLIK